MGRCPVRSVAPQALEVLKRNQHKLGYVAVFSQIDIRLLMYVQVHDREDDAAVAGRGGIRAVQCYEGAEGHLLA